LVLSIKVSIDTFEASGSASSPDSSTASFVGTTVSGSVVPDSVLYADGERALLSCSKRSKKTFTTLWQLVKLSVGSQVGELWIGG
jgi:hypothetical protein